MSPPQKAVPDNDAIRTYNVRCDGHHKKAQFSLVVQAPAARCDRQCVHLRAFPHAAIVSTSPSPPRQTACRLLTLQGHFTSPASSTDLWSRNDLASGAHSMHVQAISTCRRGANGPCHFDFSIRSLTDQCLGLHALQSSCCSLSKQFSLRFNDSQSLPATPCNMDATVHYRAPDVPQCQGRVCVEGDQHRRGHSRLDRCLDAHKGPTISSSRWRAR